MKKTMFALRHYLGVPCANIMTFILCGVGVFVLFVLWYLVPGTMVPVLWEERAYVQQ